MSRFRTHWLALFGGVTLLALSLSTAFGAKPEGDNFGSQVSAFVHSLQGDDEENDEQADEEGAEEGEGDTEAEEETEEDTEVEADEETASSDHGQCVAEVARDKEAVGPPNDNHGGAVSEAARVTCWEDGDEAADDSGDDSEANEVEGTSTEASTPGHGHGKGHGKGHARHNR